MFLGNKELLESLNVGTKNMECERSFDACGIMENIYTSTILDHSCNPTVCVWKTTSSLQHRGPQQKRPHVKFIYRFILKILHMS